MQEQSTLRMLGVVAIRYTVPGHFIMHYRQGPIASLTVTHHGYSYFMGVTNQQLVCNNQQSRIGWWV